MSETSHPSHSPANGRLDSWKEIASYLRRTVRTVQNWERTEGLPVRRHRHGTRGTVYALPDELDAWLAQREEAPQDAPVASRWGRPAAVGGLVAAVLLVGGSVFVASRAFDTSPANPVAGAPSHVLIAAFENRTGEPLFDNTLEAALERELAHSSRISVVPRPRVEDALRLMRRPVDTPLDPAVAREVCLRDGRIEILIAGRIERLGKPYVISARVLETASGKVLAVAEEEASDHENILPAMRRLASRMREALGEEASRVEQSETELVKVTTPSLRALQLYSEADRIIGSPRGDAAAEQLLREAVAEDPEFASAWIHLAHAIRNQGRPPEDYIPAAKRALELAPTSGPVERHFIRGGYFSMIGEQEEAIASYQALLRLRPDHMWAVNNLAFNLQPLDPARALPYVLRRAELRPQDLRSNFLAASSLYQAGRLEEARPFARRGVELAEEDLPDQMPWALAWIRSFPAWELWLRGDLEAVERELARGAGRLEAASRDERVALAAYLVFGYRGLGQVERARTFYRELPGSTVWQGIDAFQRNDRPELVRNLSIPPPPFANPPPLTTALRGFDRMFFLARAGYVSPAKGLLAQADARASQSPEATLLRAQVALVEGDTDAGIALLEANRSSQVPPTTAFLWAIVLAETLRERGNHEAALKALEEVEGWRERSYLAQEGWLASRVELVRAYRDLGRHHDAEAVEAQVRRLLAKADPDFWLLCELAQPAEPCTARVRDQRPVSQAPEAAAGARIPSAASDEIASQ